MGSTSTPEPGLLRGSAEQAENKCKPQASHALIGLGGWGQATCTACLKMCLMRTERRALDFEKGDAYEGKGIGPCCSSMWDQTFCPGPSPAAE
jgi:hypothetical protein